MYLDFFRTVLERFLDLIKAPYNFPDMLWIAIPLVLAVILMEIYFGRYKFEELGWNTAYGNSLVLIFVSMNLLRFVYVNKLYDPLTIKAALVFALILVGLFLSGLSFFHVLPKNLAFAFYSKSPINIAALIVVLLVYSDIPVDLATSLSVILLGIILYLLIRFVWFLVPEVLEVEE